eukprot:TRINITY_DN8876_c0_g1_i1.p1 TRINITY_DN8876_c0_g1~~TRINITY_DN8876_c0_g1_i1.p1  ORF type:complete len:239 (-),score=41.13 TRINITY_DN8876_c0_g1_i1:285-941(-)
MGEHQSSRDITRGTPMFRENDAPFRAHAGISIADEAKVSSVAECIQEGMTTLMLIDLPYALLLADLRDEMAILGFGDSYDFIFYPKERKKHFRGYCFVNFVSTAEAKRFAQLFVEHKFELVPSSKLSNAQLSRSQGLEANLAKIKPSAARFDNLFIDWTRFQRAHGGNAVGGIEGWYGAGMAAEGYYPEHDISEPYRQRYDWSRDVASIHYPLDVRYQ